MPSKETAHRNDQFTPKRRLSPQKAPDAGEADQPVAAAIGVQRARIEPRLLATQDVKHLQRAIGNRAVGRLLAQTRPQPRVSSPQRNEQPGQHQALPAAGRDQTIDATPEHASTGAHEPMQARLPAQRLDIGKTPEQKLAHPLQRTLTIEQSWKEGWTRSAATRFRTQVLAALNQLLQGSGVQASETNGVVTLTGQPIALDDPRFLLLDNIINSPRTVLVRRTEGNADTDIDRSGSKQQVDQRLQDATDETGADAIVIFDPLRKNLVPTTEGTQEMPSWLILGHELIHGSRIQGGRAAIDPKTGERPVGLYTDLAHGQTQIGHIEEMQVVGLQAYSEGQIETALAEDGALSQFKKSEKANYLLKGNEQLRDELVTENALREAHKLPLRSGYPTHLQNVLVVEKMPGGAPIKRLDALQRPRGPNKRLLLLAGALLVGFVSWYYRDYIGSMLQSSPVQRHPAGQRKRQRSPGVVVQRIGVSPHKWGDAVTVEALRKGVYKVTGQGNAIIIKTSADTESPLDEAVAAQTGVLVGVNTVVPQPFATDRPDLIDGIKRLAELQPHGALLPDAVAGVPYVLVMPFIPGKDLQDANQELAEASPQQLEEWGTELGRIFILDLVLLNPDRHGENIRFGEDNKLHAIDQVVGQMVQQPELSHLAGAKLEQKLKNLPAQKELFFKKVLPQVPEIPAQIQIGFEKGIGEAVNNVQSLQGKHIDSFYAGHTGKKGERTAPGIAQTLDLIKTLH